LQHEYDFILLPSRCAWELFSEKLHELFHMPDSACSDSNAKSDSESNPDALTITIT
jgi:hypothetical protein